jgi:hypothetical protein
MRGRPAIGIVAGTESKKHVPHIQLYCGSIIPKEVSDRFRLAVLTRISFPLSRNTTVFEELYLPVVPSSIRL